MTKLRLIGLLIVGFSVPFLLKDKLFNRGVKEPYNKSWDYSKKVWEYALYQCGYEDGARGLDLNNRSIDSINVMETLEGEVDLVLKMFKGADIKTNYKLGYEDGRSGKQRRDFALTAKEKDQGEELIADQLSALDALKKFLSSSPTSFEVRPD